MNDLLKKAKGIILTSDVKWQVRDIDEDHLILVHVEEGKKADCGTACCLGCLLWPVGIIYAILGGTNGSSKQLIVRLIEGQLCLEGEPEKVLKTYELLRNSELGKFVKETENIIKIRKTKKYVTIGWIVLIILLFFIIASSGNQSR